MLEEILDYLHNDFAVPGAERSGVFTIASGTLDADFLQYGQYYRIEGSVFNDGVHLYAESGMVDETFDGVIVPMAVPMAVQKLAEEIAAWCAANPETDKLSESFGGYSYTRAADAAGVSRWQSVFGGRLRAWKKVCR